MNSAECLELTTLPLLDVEGEPDTLDLKEIEEVEPFEVEKAASTEVVEHFDDAIKIYLREVHKSKLLTADEERALAARIDRGDKAARAKMITSNLRLVVKMARHYQNRGLPLLDLIEEGNLGLIKAVDRFQLSKGCRFTTYASWWIRQSIERALVNQSRTIRLPVHISDDIGKLTRATRELVRRLQREPTIQELAEYLKVEESRVRKTLIVFMKTYSMEEPMGDGDFCLSDTIEDTSLVDPDELFGNLDRYELVTRNFGVLTSAEMDILTLRFGLEDKTPQTLDTIGQRFGVTRERIRQIESKALEKLRKCVVNEAPQSAEEQEGSTMPVAEAESPQAKKRPPRRRKPGGIEEST